MGAPGSKAENRISKILEAALEVFSHKGYRDAAVDDIAAASQTSKGGVYFHFPNKQAIFLALLDRMADLLLSRAAKSMEAEPEWPKKGDAALATMLHTFAGHRNLTRLFLVEALGAGREFNQKLLEMHATFTTLIQVYLDEGVAQNYIAPLDTRIASTAWFGAVNEVVTRWVLDDNKGNLEDAYKPLRELLRRGIGL
jgi:AcrR family transcriptional regulator